MHVQYTSPSSSRVLVILIFIIALLNLPGALRAEETIRESFATPDGGLPDDWMAVIGGSPHSAAINTDAEGYGPGLWQCRSPEGGGNSVIYLGSQYDERRISDFFGSVVITTNKPWTGIVLRAESRTLTNMKGYFIGLNPMKTNGALIISRSPTSHVDVGEVLATTPLPFDVALEPLVLKFSAEGSKLAASIFHWNNGNPDFKSPIASVQIDDAMIDGGFFGLRSAFGNSGWVVWKDLDLTIQN